MLHSHDTGGGSWTYIGARNKQELEDVLQMLYDINMLENPAAKRERIAAQRQRKLDLAAKKGIRVGSRIQTHMGTDPGTVVSISPAGKITIEYDYNGERGTYTTTPGAIRKADVINESEPSDEELFGDWRNKIDRVNWESIEIDGIDRGDHPDYVDAFVSYAEWKNGQDLTDEELDWLTNELQDSGELNQMVHDRLYEDDDPTDDELFGKPGPARLIAKWLDGFANTMRDHPEEISGLDPSDGDEYLNDLEEIREEAKTVRFVAKAFERNGIVSGLRAWAGYSNDWWENFEDNMMVDTGVNLSALFDKYDEQLRENTEPSDDDLFGKPMRWQDRLVDMLNEANVLQQADNAEGAAEMLADADVFLQEHYDGDDLWEIHNALEHMISDLEDHGYDSFELDRQLEDLVSHFERTMNESEPSDDELFGEGLKPMSEVLGFLNEHDYDELIDQGFAFGGYPEHDRAVLDDHLEYKNLSVLTVRFNPDNEDDPLVRVVPRQMNENDEPSDDDLFGTRNMYYVNLMGNYNTGRYSDYGGRRYIVPGASPEDAVKWLKRNEDWVYMYMDSQKLFNGKRVVRRPARDNVFLDNSSIFGEAPEGSNSAIENFIRKHRAV